MNPQERELLERTLKISEENNQILLKMQKTAQWAIIWGFIKVAVIFVPLIAGYIFLQPFIEQSVENLDNVKKLLNS